ncbi:Phosphorylated carbohydrates phosphatase [Falsiruegeria litorea R37]|uniref:Phosphorylated carbohydrates phosphatase n=2 Tax=Falsiruegeria litorea TaxID=1280831 RepID=A0A1Y5SDK5_9RHOB|nr:Phosphorylated carbohydrates phosphatase [Falsiruegeria litorea R37]
MTLSPVIFDMDGLLLDTKRLCLQSFVETRRHFSLPDNLDTFLKCIGLRGAEPVRIIRESLNGAMELDVFNDEWGRRIDARYAQGVPVKPGALELVQLLDHNGHSLAVATSTQTADARQRLQAAQLLHHFEFVIGGDQVSRPKPDPEIFHKAAAELGVNVQDCVAFEDSETGVRSAHASGAKTVQIPDLIQPSMALRALGHIIAPGLIEGAVTAGLLSLDILEARR